jgi:hypothetical protein
MKNGKKTGEFGLWLTQYFKPKSQFRVPDIRVLTHRVLRKELGGLCRENPHFSKAVIVSTKHGAIISAWHHSPSLHAQSSTPITEYRII